MARRTRSSSAQGKKQKVEKEEEEEEEVVEEEEVEEEVEEDENNEDEADSDDDDEEDEEEEEDVAAALFNSANAQDDDDAESDNEDDEKDTTMVAMDTTPSQVEPYTFDLRNMLAISTDQLLIDSLYDTKNTKKNKTAANNNKSEEEIPLDPKYNRGSLSVQIDEEYLLSKATVGCTQLVRALWQLPTEQSDAGPLITLPTYDEIKLPRAMPPPPPKQETKWEKFAKLKGISLNKEKRSRKVWDEESGSWMFRHGYEAANRKDNEWPIMEVGATDDPFEDPWEKQRELKREKVEKNTTNRLKNEERAGNLIKGTTNRIMKGRLKTYEDGKISGRKDSSSLPLPSGLPVDLLNTNNPNIPSTMRGKKSTLTALMAVQRSTASRGKFDKMREGEPERKNAMTKQKKRKFENSDDKKAPMTEGQSSMKILNAVMNGGGVAKQKNIRKGLLAKGETAYDYDFNDGLGASTFKKKKGRAGSGKMKKMTKKRAK